MVREPSGVSTGGSAAESERRLGRGDRTRLEWAFWLALALALLPSLVIGVRVLFSIGSDWYPSTDHALIEAQVGAVGRHAVLVGPYSRAGFHFPGPVLFYLLAIPYRLFGGASIGLLLGALLVNTASIAGLALVARRRGELLLGIVLSVATLAVVHSLGAGVLIDPWNPYVTLLPFALLIVVAWALASGDAWMLPVALGVGSFVVQSHVAYGVMTALLILFGVGGLLMARRARRRMPSATESGEPRWYAVGAVSGLVLAVLWVLPIIDQVTGGDNLGLIVRYFWDNPGTTSWVEAVRVVALQWSWRPDWLVGARQSWLGVPPYRSAIDVPVALLLGIGATVFAWRRRDRPMLVFAATLSIGFIGAVVSVHGVTGPIYRYLVAWTWVLGMMLGVLVTWVVVRACITIPSARVRGAVLAAGCGATVVLVVASTVQGTNASTPLAGDSARIRAISEQLRRNLPPSRLPEFVAIQPLDGFTWEVASQLLRNGSTVRTSEEGGFYLGDWAVVGPRTRYRELTVLTGPQARAALERPPDGRVVVAHTTLPGAGTSAADRRAALATARYLFGPGSGAARRVERLLRETRGDPAIVVLAPRT